MVLQIFPCSITPTTTTMTLDKPALLDWLNLDLNLNQARGPYQLSWTLTFRVSTSQPGQTLVTGNVWGKSCTGGITLKNVLDLSVLHSFLTRFNRKTLFQILQSGCKTFPTSLHSHFQGHARCTAEWEIMVVACMMMANSETAGHQASSPTGILSVSVV